MLAVAMTAFMVSLAGVPPTGGFWGKILIFQAAIERGGIGPWLAVIMLVELRDQRGVLLRDARSR